MIWANWEWECALLEMKWGLHNNGFLICAMFPYGKLPKYIRKVPNVERQIVEPWNNFQRSSFGTFRLNKVTSDLYANSIGEHILLCYADENLARSVVGSELIKVKFEVDTTPPPYAGFERQFRLLPIPYEINLYDMPSLFAGKLHAVICRAWKNRIKGRDLYDYVFYLSSSKGDVHVTAICHNLPRFTQKCLFAILACRGIRTSHES